MKPRVFEVKGYLTIDDDDAAYGYPLEQIREELSDQVGLGDLGEVTVTEISAE